MVSLAFYLYVYLINQYHFEGLLSEIIKIALFLAWAGGFFYFLNLIIPTLILDVCLGVPVVFVSGFISRNKDNSAKAIGFMFVALSYIIEYYFKFSKR